MIYFVISPKTTIFVATDEIPLIHIKNTLQGNSESFNFKKSESTLITINESSLLNYNRLPSTSISKLDQISGTLNVDDQILHSSLKQKSFNLGSDVNLALYYQNVRGINSKLSNILVNSLELLEFDLLVLTETWLNPNVSNGEFLDLNTFDVIRKDRDFSATSSTRGGGILIAFKKHLQVSIIALELFSQNFNDLKHIDILAIKLRVGYQYIYCLF